MAISLPGAETLPKPKVGPVLRPITPDGTPVLGSMQYDNLFMNTGSHTIGANSRVV
ncbi:hypothetical protein RV134_200066 [Roseovarius sp. EC-HK134]|nr:hypothetical protein RV420_200020 [Roseovarius sp. EC-SD190]VVS99422.1 hypothetical protein RV134_200066 [Roseovarius sp. EC-HK134]